MDGALPSPITRTERGGSMIDPAVVPSGRKVVELAPVAGIPVVHEIEGPIAFTDGVPWSGTVASDAAIRVRHRIAPLDTTGMRVLFHASPSCTFFADGDGAAVLFRGAVPGVPDQLLVSRRAGYAYDLIYAHEPAVPMYQRAKDRTILSMALAQRGRGYVVHACGFALDGAGVLCPGLPSAGKSTLARLLGGLDASVADRLSLLSDDRVALTAEGDGFRMWGTPWPGDAMVVGAGDAPLRAIVLLRHGDGCTLRAMAPGAAGRRFMETLILPLWDRRAMPGALAFVDRVLHHVPVFELVYEPTDAAVRRFLDQLSKNSSGAGGQ